MKTNNILMDDISTDRVSKVSQNKALKNLPITYTNNYDDIHCYDFQNPLTEKKKSIVLINDKYDSYAQITKPETTEQGKNGDFNTTTFEDDVIYQLHLGYMYAIGRNGNIDYLKAFECFKKSAEKGNSTAQYNLGYMYEKGYGITPDINKAIYWYSQSAYQGEMVSVLRLTEYGFYKASLEDDATAQLHLGYMYITNSNGDADYAKAFKCFKQSAEKGNSAAEYNLGLMYEKGYGVNKNPSLSQKYYIAAYKHGDWDAKMKLHPEYKNPLSNLDEINSKFSHLTKLNKTDMSFLMIATALQCVRQYLLDPWIKNKRLFATADDEKGRKLNAEPGWYHADTDKILNSRVPFDAQGYSNNASVQGFLKGGNHRNVTLGHDPLLGWIFGTANILTNTLTRADFKSAHIKDIPGKGNTIYALADTKRIFLSCKDRLMNEGTDGKIAVGAAVIREGMHLKSDLNTKHSLPLPGIQSVSPELAKKLTKYGIDTASVGTEISTSVLINTLISMVHRLYFDESVDDIKMYAVRTRKILLYSNFIATTSNIAVSCLTKKYDMLDVGGILVTITRLFSDVIYIAKLKQDYINSHIDEQFNGVQKEIDDMYKLI